MKPGVEHTRIETGRFEICENKVIIMFRHRIHEFKLNKGMRYLAALLYYKGLPVPFEQLEQSVHGSPHPFPASQTKEDLLCSNMHQASDYHAYEMVDLRAVKEIKHRLNQIIAELAETETWHNYARNDELLEERDSLVSYLKEVYLPGGKRRVFTTEHTLQRKRILKALNRTLADIEAVDPELALHLKRSLRFGDLLVYHPEGFALDVKGYWACVSEKKH